MGQKYGKNSRYRRVRRKKRITVVALGVLAVLLLAGVIAFLIQAFSSLVSDSASSRVDNPLSSSENSLKSGEISKTESSQSQQVDPADLVLQEQSSDWRLLLVNPQNPMPEGYTVNVVEYDDVEMDERICDAYKEMQRDARENGYTLWISSAYRSVEKQQDLLDAEVSRHMREDGLSEEAALKKALQTMTIPGYSEHNTGLAIDLNGVTAIEDEEYEWLCQHAADYGFILRYPQGKEAVTGIQFEAWHFRYVGQEHAQYMVQHDMCLEEYIAYLIETGQF